MITVWLTGLPSSGKSTLAEGVWKALAWGRQIEVLDGDALRGSPLSDELGFSREDRIRQARRTAFVAQRLNAHGVLVIVALVSPYEEGRRAAKELLPGFLEVYVCCSAETCQERDVKGLYGRARRGELTGLTGYDAPYEPPAAPDIVLDTDRESVETSIKRLVEVCRGRLVETGFII